MNHFKHLVTVEEIKSHYRRLAMMFHPDKGGDLELMKLLNAEYIVALKAADGRTSEGSDGKEHTYRFDETLEQAVIDKIDELLRERLQEVDISLIGTWIWVTGETKPVKERLKAVGCKWHSVRECWFWNATPWKGGRSRSDLSELAEKYGCKKFRPQEFKRVD